MRRALRTIAHKAYAYMQRKSPPDDFSSGGLFDEKRRLPTLPHCIAVPSAQAGLTSLFGMGRGGTPPLSPPNMGDMLRVTDFYLSF